MNSGKVKKKRKAMNWGLLALAVPGLFFLIAYYYVPLFGLVIPFKKMDVAKGIFGSDWCGLDNFKFFFQSPDAWTVTRNTIGLNAVFISMTLVLSVIVALENIPDMPLCTVFHFLGSGKLRDLCPAESGYGCDSQPFGEIQPCGT